MADYDSCAIPMSGRMMKPTMWLPCVALLLTAAGDNTILCRNVTGDHGGLYHTFWHDSGDGCMTLDRHGGYNVYWKLSKQGNLVAGRGWRRGSPDRVIGYRARQFVPGANGYLAVYGWSTNPLVEYYIVEAWGGFKPPSPDAISLGTVRSDGGNYHLYRTRRVEKPSIEGTASFDQYWSVRDERRALNRDNTVTLANHVDAWRQAGMTLGSLDYQVLATEGFGSTGASSIVLWDASPRRKAR